MPIVKQTQTNVNVPENTTLTNNGVVIPSINNGPTVQSTPGIGNGLGLINTQKGSDNPPSNTTGNVRENVTLSKAMDNFKYGQSAGIDSNRDNFLANFDYEDPTYLGFKLVFLKDTSPLFTTNTNRNSALNFINQYGTNASNSTITLRKDYLNKFIIAFNSIFKFDTDNGNAVKSKIYYIQNIAGADKLNAKIVKYMEDKLTITLNEDISMLALYIAELYNNLAYDYKNQRNVIPINCLRFDMKVRITDLRNFKKPNASSNTTLVNESSNTNVSSLIYILRDCHFDFYNSQNHTESLIISGDKSESATLKFDIYYKSIEREINPLLINATSDLNNKASNGKGVATETGFNDAKNLTFNLPPSIKSQDSLKNSTYNISNIEQQANNALVKQKQNQSNQLKNAFGITDIEAVINKGISTVTNLTAENILDYAKEKGLQIAARARNTLFNLVVAEIKTNVRTPIMDPENVYLSDASKVNVLELKVAGENLIGNKIPTSWGDLKNTGIAKAASAIQGGNPF